MSLTKQQEAFALNLLKGMNQTDAYKAAGYKCANDNVAAVSASELVRNPKVVQFMDAFRQKAAESVEIDLRWLIRESVETYQAARKDGAHAAANATLKTVGVYTGHWNEQSTVTRKNDLDEFTEAELAALARAGSAGAAKSQDRSQEPDRVH